jgi:hypothetical protein
MQLSLERIFPIHDAPSARLMKLKADCLLKAGVIDRSQKRGVDVTADAVLGSEHLAHFVEPELDRISARH